MMRDREWSQFMRQIDGNEALDNHAAARRGVEDFDEVIAKANAAIVAVTETDHRVKADFKMTNNA